MVNVLGMVRFNYISFVLAYSFYHIFDVFMSMAGLLDTSSWMSEVDLFLSFLLLDIPMSASLD